MQPRAGYPDPTSADPSTWPVGRLLSTTARRVERLWNAHLAGWDLNHASLPVLLYLLEAPRSQRELAEAVAVTEQTMSRLIARLERLGLVTRQTDLDDRRRRDVHITALGQQAAAQAADPHHAERIVTDALTPEQVALLHDLLTQIIQYDDTHAGRPDGGR